MRKIPFYRSLRATAILLGLILCVTSVNGQSDYQTALATADSLRKSGDPQASLKFYDLALASPAGTTNLEFRSVATVRKGIGHLALNQYEDALQCFNIVIEMDSTQISTAYRGHAHNNKAVVQLYRGMHEAAEYNYKQAGRLYNLIDDSVGVVLADLNIAMIYRLEDKYLKAEQLLVPAIQFFELYHMNVELAEAYNEMAIIQMNYGEKKKARHYFRRAIEIREAVQGVGLINSYNGLASYYRIYEQFDSAQVYFEKALKLKLPKGDHVLPSVYHNAGVNYFYKGQSAKSLKHIKRALELIRSLSDSGQTGAMLNDIAMVYLSLDSFEQCISALTKARSYLGAVDQPGFVQRNFEVTKEYYRKLETFDSAFLYLNKAHDVQRNVVKSNYTRELAVLQETFEADKRNLEIEGLEGENTAITGDLYTTKMESKTLERENLWLMWALGISAVISVGVYVIFRQRTAIKAINARMEGVELEKKRVSRELHDGVGAVLASIKLRLQLPAAKARTETSEFIAQIDQIYDKVKQVAHDLHPPKVAKFSFYELIEDYVLEWNSDRQFSIELDIGQSSSWNLTPLVKRNLFRCVQELLTNIGKHADAKTVQITTRTKGRKGKLMIKDDGKSKATKTEGLGMQTIRSRVEECKGDVLWDFGADGTAIEISLPV
jgi:two-component system NarL family sensor kinase